MTTVVIVLLFENKYIYKNNLRIEIILVTNALKNMWYV